MSLPGGAKLQRVPWQRNDAVTRSDRPLKQWQMMHSKLKWQVSTHYHQVLHYYGFINHKDSMNIRLMWSFWIWFLWLSYSTRPCPPMANRYYWLCLFVLLFISLFACMSVCLSVCMSENINPLTFGLYKKLFISVIRTLWTKHFLITSTMTTLWPWNWPFDPRGRCQEHGISKIRLSHFQNSLL